MGSWSSIKEKDLLADMAEPIGRLKGDIIKIFKNP